MDPELRHSSPVGKPQTTLSSGPRAELPHPVWGLTIIGRPNKARIVMSKHVYIEQTNDGRFGIKPGKAAPPVMTTRTQKEAIQYSKMMFPDSRDQFPGPRSQLSEQDDMGARRNRDFDRSIALGSSGANPVGPGCHKVARKEGFPLHFSAVCAFYFLF
jgi:hypothetical protein